MKTLFSFFQFQFLFLLKIKSDIFIPLNQTFLFLQVNIELGMNYDGEMMTEDVCLDYNEKYIKINAQALEGKTPVMVIYDNTEVKFIILYILQCK